MWCDEHVLVGQSCSCSWLVLVLVMVRMMFDVAGAPPPEYLLS